MTVFNSPTTNSLQALVMWNDVQFLEAARVLAQRTLAERGSREDRLKTMFRRATGRRPGSRELTILGNTLTAFTKRFAAQPADAERLLQQGETMLPPTYEAAELAAWMMLGNTMLSLDETIVRD